MSAGGGAGVPGTMTGTGRARSAVAPAGIAALATAALLVRQQESGPGFTWDAVYYVCAARNLLAGDGFAGCDGRLMIEWGPLYPALLALASVPGFDPREVAGPLNAAFFGAFVFVVGLWLRRSLESPFLAAWGCLAVALSVPLARIFSIALSEPPFLLFAMLALICADRSLGGGRRRWLAWAAAFTALAWATRYAGVAVAIAIGAALLLERGPALHRKVARCMAYLLASAAAIGVWMTRNLVKTGSPVRPPREVDYSLSESFAGIARAVGNWALHDSAPHGDGAIGGAVLLLLAAGVGCSGARALLNRRGPPSPSPAERSFLLFGGFALAYVAFYAWTTVSGRTWHGVLSRHLLPIYVPVLFAALWAADRVVSAGRRLDGERRRRAWSRGPALVLAAAFVSWLSLGAYSSIRETLHQRVEGYGHPRWAGSEVVRYLRDNVPDGVVWTTNHAPLHLFAGGTARYAGLPADKPIGELAPTTGRTTDTALQRLRRRAGDGDLVVWFRDSLHDVLFDYDAGDVYALPEGYLLAALEDGLVFRIDKGAGRPPELSATPPAHGRAPFDVHLRARDGRTRLVVVDRRCGGGGGAPFFLRVWPVRAADLSLGREEHGFNEIEFDFVGKRARYGSICVASAALPEYAATHVSIGQFADDGPLWRTEFRLQGGAHETSPRMGARAG